MCSFVTDLTLRLILLQLIFQVQNVCSGAQVSGNVTSVEDAFSIFGSNVRDFWCPQSCVCSSKEKIIDCSSLKLKRVPVLPKATKRLYLHNNNITSLHHYHLHLLDQLTYLILSGNNIRDIDSEVFSDLQSLKYLILDGNNISQLSPTAFKELSDLETISLAKNQLEFLPHGIFTNNDQLTLINLQGNLIHKVDIGVFSDLQRLTTLNLADNQLDEQVFDSLQDLKQLTTLRLNGNQIKFLPPEGLQFKTLKYLALHANNITNLPRVLMKNCSSLEILTLNQNAIEEVKDSIFEGCSNLVKMYIQKNHLKMLSIKAFSNLTSLEEIYLCNNQLRDLVPGVFFGLNSLITVHLEWNELFYIKKHTFFGLPKLETIYLHHNSISHIEPGAFVGLPRLKYLVLYKNNLRIIRPAVLNQLNSLKKIQVDPLKCSCSLMPLATWLKSHHLKGISCIKDDGRIFTITSLEELCYNLKGSYILQRTKGKHHVFPEPKVLDYLKVTAFKPTPELPKGPPFYQSKQEMLTKKIHLLERTVAQLHLKVSRLEVLLTTESTGSCLRKVCLYDGTRLLVGDMWTNSEGRKCSCLQDGSVDCSNNGN